MSITQEVNDAMRAALYRAEADNPRSQQAREGILGPSDIGFCRQKAVLVTRGVEPSDEKKTWPAQVGTAIHTYVEAALKRVRPEWLMGSIDNVTVTATLPSGASISGHPDIIAPDLNAILDLKTVDGFEKIARYGPSNSHKYQRHLYALGAIEAGLLRDGEPVYVGNVYLDRSGEKPEPVVYVEEIDWTLTAEIDSWVQDVIYAVRNSEDAPRDVAASVCENICEFYTACRGGMLPVEDGNELIEDEDRINAIRLYVDGRDLEQRAKQMKREAQAVLVGTNGVGAGFQVRWTSIAPTTVKASERPGYMRLDVKPVKAPRSPE